MRRRQAKGAGGAARDGEASARRFGSLASACVDRPRAFVRAGNGEASGFARRIVNISTIR
ncbi:unnamed protein product [Burkholderia pseudomallei]|nr:unnamed protein product [Burkholderia pseudomallei]